MNTRERTLSAALIEFADTLVSDYDLLDYLDLLLERSTHVLGASAGGVMLADQAAELQLLASTDERMRVMELFELQRREGPCVDSFKRGEQVFEERLAASQRWPQFAPVAVEQGYQSAFAFPLRLRGQVIGALNIFRDQPGGVPDADVRAAQAFADMATIGILQERAVRQARELAGQLQTALNSRIVIEQAKGIIAERVGMEVGSAYDVLRQFSRDRNLRLREVAAAIVAGTLDAASLPEARPGKLGAP